MMGNLQIEVVALEDAWQLLEIYRYYVENTAITFEYETPSLEEFKQRIITILKRYPYLVAKVDGQITGYVYASAFHERAAYDWCVETSIYLKPDCCHQGTGRILYQCLENILRLQHVTNMNACIASPVKPGPYLDDNSIRFHEHMGFQPVGKFHSCGYKFQSWFDMIWMEKMINDHQEKQLPLLRFDEVKKAVFDEKNRYQFKSEVTE